MPVARIFAAFVEEAEPLCSDLLARGYDVEVVFPDAVLPNPADLELRVERCSPEQAIARVESTGSPSRCMFVTPAKGPRRELLLVEMTVGTGTDGRHPVAMPFPMPVLVRDADAPATAESAVEAALRSAAVLAFPVNPNSADNLPAADSASSLPGPVVQMREASDEQVSEQAAEQGALQAIDVPLAKQRSDAYIFSKDSMAEFNAFLAHAPKVNRPNVFPVRIFETVRASEGMHRARRNWGKNWEGLTLTAVATAFAALLTLGWYAGPSRPHQLVQGVSGPVRTVADALKQDGQDSPGIANSVVPAPLRQVAITRLVSDSQPLPKRFDRPMGGTPHRSGHSSQSADEVVAQDRVVRMDAGRRTESLAEKLGQRETVSEVIHPAAMRTVVTPVTAAPKLASALPAPPKSISDQPTSHQLAPIKKISDLN